MNTPCKLQEGYKTDEDSPGTGGTPFNSRTLGGRGRWISVSFKPVWSIDVGSRQPRLHTVKPYLKDNNNNKIDEVGP